MRGSPCTRPWAGGIGFRVACFGAVFTSPAQRAQGLGTRLFAAAVARAREQGAELGLVSGARGLYARAGFTPLPPCRRYQLRATGEAGAFAVSRVDAASLPALMALHAAEPVRFVRSPRALAAPHRHRRGLLRPGRHPPPAGGDKRSLRLPGGGPAPPLPPTDRRCSRPRDGRRPSGDRRALPALMRELGAPALELIVPAHEASLEPFAGAHGWHRDELQFPFSAAWWNPQLRGLPVPWYGLDYV
jgi:hypothetical protein